MNDKTPDVTCSKCKAKPCLRCKALTVSLSSKATPTRGTDK